MIYDQLDSPTAALVLSRHPILSRALEWLRALPDDAPEGIVKWDGSPIFANIHSYATRPKTGCRWESHRETVDFQYCRAGGEFVQWTTGQTLVPDGDYRAENDTQNWKTSELSTGVLHLKPGCFAIFLAGEPHLPMLHDGKNLSIHKVVVKIPARLL
jgi:YhcH/YjgK/YiaL family protein